MERLYNAETFLYYALKAVAMQACKIHDRKVIE